VGTEVTTQKSMNGGLFTIKRKKVTRLGDLEKLGLFWMKDSAVLQSEVFTTGHPFIWEFARLTSVVLAMM
jgi:hypothetical protein